MTPEEFTKQLPPFANDLARSKPPFAFKNLSVRVFPLRASLDALQQVCNGYLNFVPRGVGRFRAVVPYAYVALLDYDQISEMEMESSVGWFAQAEVYFGVPVEWYQVVNGRWVFRDWAVITPFIYVDDDFSVPLGRTVFGFPKTLARVTKAASEWLRDPFAPVTLALVETLVFPELYKGRPLESKVFLEVERDAPMSNFRMPADATSPIAPWVIASKLAEAMAGFGRDAMSIAQSMRIFEPNPGTHPTFGVEMLDRLMPGFVPGGKGFTLNSINLKQFRSSSNPDRISYQALTNGRMQMTAFNGAGPLGEERSALGDLTGGYTIKLHEYSSLPIARTLGLEVHRRWRGDGVDVVALKPVMPFWANVNVKYLEGTNLAWRTRDGIWHGGNGKPLGDSGNGCGGGSGDPSRKLSSQKLATEGSDWPVFNTTVTSAADAAIAGPFEFTGTTIRVLPLLAYRQTLKDFLDRSINKALCDPGSTKHYRLSVWSRRPVKKQEAEYAYVYMTASSLGAVTSKTNNVGDWAKYELSFLIPVKWECEVKPDRWEVEGFGLVPAYNLVDATTAAVSRTEVLGIPTLRAEFVRSQSVWLQEGEADLGAKQTLLRVEAEGFTALHADQQAAMHPLIEISERDFAGIGEPDSRANPSEWARVLTSELESKIDTERACRKEFRIARALALEVLGNRSLIASDHTDDRNTDDRMPVSLYTLKQFRDVADPGKACYQSLVRVPRVFDEVFDVREIEETIRVRIHEFPSLKLVESLGIVAKTVREEGAGIVYGTQAIRPFYIRATIHELQGERLLWRAGALEWELDDRVESLLSDDGQQQIKVDLQAARVQDQGDPCQMKSIVHQSTQRRMNRQQKPSESDFIEREQKEQKVAALKEAVENGEERILKTGRFTKKERDRFQELRKLSKQRNLTKEKQEELKTLERKIDLEMLPDNERDRLQELKLSKQWDLTPEEQRDLTPKEQEELKTLEFLEKRKEWQLRERIEKLEARLALETVDPQMVVESILSREWGNFNENARWRVGREKLRKAREIGFSDGSGGSAAFAALGIPMAGDDVSIHAAIEKLITDGRTNFASVEAGLYQAIREEKAHRPGSPRLDKDQDVTDMIERMKEFTTSRLEMEDHFSVLAAWSISRWPKSTLERKFTDEFTTQKEPGVHKKLVTAMREIALLGVIGEPSKDNNTQVRNDWIRLNALLKVLSRHDLPPPRKAEPARDMTPNVQRRKGFGPEAERFRDERATEDAWRLIDQYREAVHLARKYCNVQRDALFNKLSRAYQKPDFCIKRDSVGPERDDLFSISLSWDEDWYYGRDPA